MPTEEMDELRTATLMKRALMMLKEVQRPKTRFGPNDLIKLVRAPSFEAESKMESNAQPLGLAQPRTLPPPPLLRARPPARPLAHHPFASEA